MRSREKYFLKTACAISSFLGILIGTGPFFLEKISLKKTPFEKLNHESTLLIRPVSITQAKISDFKKTFSLYSALKGKHEVTLYTDSKVLVKKVLIKPGMSVKKGQLLAILDSHAIKIRNQLNELDFKQKEAEYVVTKNLADKQYVSKNEMTQKDLEFQAEKLRKELAKTEATDLLFSPIDGIISDVKINEGDFVDDFSKYYIKVVDKSSFRLDLYIPYEISKKIEVGSQVEITDTANEKEKSNPLARNIASYSPSYIGNVSKLAPGIDQQTGTVNIEVEAILPPEKFDVGSYVEAKFILENNKSALIIPNETILYENDKAYVFKVDMNDHHPKALKTYIETGESENGKTVIHSGIKVGDYVVTEGQSSLTHQELVKIFSKN